MILAFTENQALCGHGGKRRIVGAPVDGYDLTAKTAFQYHGCYRQGVVAVFETAGTKLSNTAKQGKRVLLKQWNEH